MKKTIICASLVCAAFSLFAQNSIPETGSAVPFTLLETTKSGVEVRNGGFGSDACAHPSNKNEFYLVTDRGPNADYKGAQGKGKLFPTPDYTPQIGLFRIKEDGSVELLKKILLKTPEGKNITGLPNPKGKGATGEIAYDLEENILGTDDYGLDSEGLVAMKDGTFWLSDEYGPHIVHYDADGVELERISPLGMTTGSRHIPAVFARRRANRGMEGLAVTKNQKTLVGIMQSTMFNPSKKALGNSQVVRVLTFDIKSGKTKQFLYLQNEETDSCSGITALSNTEFIVIERDGKFSSDGEAHKRLYKITLKGATDVSGDFESEGGLLVNGKTIEENSVEDLEKAGIKFIKKELICDLTEVLSNKYPHDKLEGVWLLDKNTIAVANDNDFALTIKDNELAQKFVGSTDLIEDDVVYTVKIK